MLNQHITIPYDEIAAFCERNHIRKLSLFGSVLRDDFNDDSDVDVLVEFELGRTPGWSIVRMEAELSEILGKNVDFRTADELSRHFRQDVLDTAIPVYEQT